MKFQFSLRALIIACLIAGIFVWIGVRSYLASYDSPELAKRRKAIWSKIDEIVKLKDAEYKKNGFVSGGGGGSRLTLSPEWVITDSRTRTDAKGITVLLFSVKVYCSRVGLEAQPIEMEFDDAVENENLIATLKQLCDENKWKYNARKVERISP